MAKNVFFALGHEAGVAIGNWLAVSVRCIVDQLEGKKDLTPASYKTMREQWIKGYVTAMKCTEKRGENAWATVWRGVETDHGIKKPKSSAAVKKAAQRDTAKTTKPETAPDAPAKGAKVAKTTKPETAPDAPAKGAKVAKTTKIELSAIEAHILSLWRRGRFGDIVALVQSEAEKTATV